MKSKKLLSVLCLLALAGCQPASTSGSSAGTSQTPSGSSTTTSTSTSSSSAASSSSSSQTPAPRPELPAGTKDDFEARLLSGVEETLAYADMTQYNVSSNNKSFSSSTFYENAVLINDKSFDMKNSTEENPVYSSNPFKYKVIKDNSR